jgi:hypothetical protein
MNALDHVHKRAAKFEKHTRDLVWEHTVQRRKVPHFCVVFKAYIGERPWKSIGDKLEGPCYIRSHDHDRKIRVREQRTDIGKYCFENRKIKTWNQVSAEALTTFSCKLRIMRKRVRTVIINEER